MGGKNCVYTCAIFYYFCLQKLMAKNTFRKNIAPENEPFNTGESVSSENSPKKSRKAADTKNTDPKIRIIVGLTAVFISIFALLSIFSYPFTGAEDQSVVDAFWEYGIRDAGKEAENWLGLFGALMAHLLVYKGFGICTLLFIPIVFIWGVKLVFKLQAIPLYRYFSYAVFLAFWISTLVGLLVYYSDTAHSLGFFCGGIGFELASIADEMLGWASFLLLMLAASVYGLVSFGWFMPKNSLTKSSATAANNFDYDNSENDTEAEDEPATNEAETLNPNNEEEDEEEALLNNVESWTIVTKPDTPKTDAPGDLELVIETPYALEQDPNPINHLPQADTAEQTAKPKTTVEDLPPYDPTLDLSRYQYPTIDLLKDYGDNKGSVVTKDELEENKNRIVQTLADFGIGITSIKATIGPTVTLYEIVPDAGIKISKIANLSDDIALRLSALGVRIIAPMPGKGTIGMEVPNKNKQMVPARDVLMHDNFANSKMELPIAFGKTISNEVFVADLATMPHLLMAGATGMGKSVGINMLLASLLYKKHPSQLKIVMVDPKKVELSLYNKIERHFLAKLPDAEEAIITDTKKVVHTLNSLCIEMDTRYSLLKDAGCRNLKEYNPKFIARKLNPNEGHRYLPYIVVVIDELADLMITAGKEIEMPIARLAQLARAVGIHLVLATQRPSVNVITGLIKANFPARLSFRVTSKVDSKIILDESGADQLVGKGDMLLKINSDMVRLQCAFVDTPEVENVVDYIGEQNGYPTAYHLPEYFDENADPSEREVDLTNRDPKFEDAAKLVVATQQGSTSLIQRKLSLGYARSGRIMDQLEAAGIVGPPNGSKVRDVLIKDERSLQEILDTL